MDHHNADTFFTEMESYSAALQDELICGPP